MKGFLIYVAVVIVCATAFFIGYQYFQAKRFSATAEPYINEVLPQISSWEAGRMKNYMDPEILAGTDSGQLASLMESLSAMGSLVKIGEPKFKNRSTGGPGEDVVISYEIETLYSGGPATVSISLIQKGDTYNVYHFNFRSKALRE